MYANNHDYDHAIPELNKAIEVAPNHFRAYYNRGNAYSKKLACDAAIADLH